MSVRRVLLVDDEPMALRALEALLAEVPSVTLVGSTADPRKALGAVLAGRVDILLVDIQMPGMTGLELVRSIPEPQLPQVIFVTAFDDYAVDAFEANAVDYLLKPVRPERLRKALARASDALRDRSASSALRRVLDALNVPAAALEAADRSDEEAAILAAPTEGGILRIHRATIVRVEALGQRSEITTERDVHVVKRSLSELERDLEGTLFVRVHRSHLLAISSIDRLERRDGGTGVAHLVGGGSIPVSRNRYPGVRSRLQNP